MQKWLKIDRIVSAGKVYNYSDHQWIYLLDMDFGRFKLKML